MKKIKNKQYGQAMVEFALTLPIFLIAVLGVIELSRFFLVYSAAYTASREASRYASSTDITENGYPQYKDCENILEIAITPDLYSGITAEQVDIFIEDMPGNVVAQCQYLNGDGDRVYYDYPHTIESSPVEYDFEFANRVLVEITTSYQPITPIIPSIPVMATNGRTILRDIRVRDVPNPFPTPTPIGWLGCNSFVFLEGTGVVNSKYDIVIRNISPDIDFDLLGFTDTDWKMNNTNLISVDWVLHSTDINGNPDPTPAHIWDGSFQKETITLDFTTIEELPSNTYSVITLTFDSNLNSQDWVDLSLVLTDNQSGILCEPHWTHP